MLVEAGSCLHAGVGDYRLPPLSIAVNVPGGIAMVKFLLEAGMVRRPIVVSIS